MLVILVSISSDLNFLAIFQGSEERLVLPAILGDCSAWREIQNLYMRFVSSKSKVFAPMYSFEGSTLYIVRSPGS